jgi:hypothetical protein
MPAVQARLDVFDPAADAWTRKKEMPMQITHLCAVAHTVMTRRRMTRTPAFAPAPQRSDGPPSRSSRMGAAAF